MSATPRLPTRPGMSSGESLTEVADYLALEGLRMAYHHHLAPWWNRSEISDRFLECTGESVGLTVDTGHAALGGVDALALIRDHPLRSRMCTARTSACESLAAPNPRARAF